MAKQDKDNESMVEKHALDRLNHVEKEHRKAYAKKPEKFSPAKIIMGIILIIVLLTSLVSIFQLKRDLVQLITYKKLGYSIDFQPLSGRI